MSADDRRAIEVDGPRGRLRGRATRRSRDSTFSIPAGRTVAVLGPNGGGKTTLFRALLGELPHRTGRGPDRGRDRLRAADRALPARLPGQRARRRPDGHLRAALPWYRPLGRAQRSAARWRRSSGSGSPTGPASSSASSPAGSASAS